MADGNGYDVGYGILFQGCRANKSVEHATASVARIDEIFRYFRFLGDRNGQTHCFMVAADGMFRSEHQGLIPERDVFRHWILSKVQGESAN